ncbi:MAG: hypothetical protein AB2813_06465, partial [Candidatus Sedimenticola endophacoides]
MLFTVCERGTQAGDARRSGCRSLLWKKELFKQVCRYLVNDFGTSQSPKSTRQRDSRYCPDR